MINLYLTIILFGNGSMCLKRKLRQNSNLRAQVAFYVLILLPIELLSYKQKLSFVDLFKELGLWGPQFLGTC